MKLAKRLDVIKPSPTLEITAKIATLKASGIDVIGFGAGEPDFDTPENIKQAAIKAIDKGYTKYTPVSGILSLKKAIVSKLERENGLSYQTDEIIISCGGKHSLFNMAMALFEAGDEVIIPSPYWVSYPEIIALTGSTPVNAPTSPEEGFLLTEKRFSDAISCRTKALILNYPSNPTGATYNREQLKKIADIAVANNILIISDEIYDRITYVDFPHCSIASLGEDIKRATVTVNGVSKAYSMTGWRIGYTAASKELIKAMTIIQSQSTSNPTSIAQYAAVEALNGSQKSVISMVREFSKRRDYILSRLNSIKGVSCTSPAGSFYVFPNISHYYGKRYGNTAINNSIDISNFLLTEGKIAVVPGVAFGDDSYIRISFSTSFSKIEQGMDRMEDALKKLKD